MNLHELKRTDCVKLNHLSAEFKLEFEPCKVERRTSRKFSSEDLVSKARFRRTMKHAAGLGLGL